jgi:GTPase SAR1 family protein
VLEVFVIKDVGGQIQHQDMWMSAFKNVRAVLYVASLDDYHRNSKDGRNRLIESLELFRMVCGNAALAGLPFVLIFNKVVISFLLLSLFALCGDMIFFLSIPARSF